MFKWILALAIAASTPALSQAATFSVGEGGKVSVDIPDNWSPQEYDGGVQAESEAGTYITVEGMKAADIGEAVKASIEDLAKQGLVINEGSQKQQEGLKINGMDCAAFAFDGTYQEKQSGVLMFFCASDADHAAVLTSWFDGDSDKTDDKAYQAILDSLKPVN